MNEREKKKKKKLELSNIRHILQLKKIHLNRKKTYLVEFAKLDYVHHVEQAIFTQLNLTTMRLFAKIFAFCLKSNFNNNNNN